MGNVNEEVIQKTLSTSSMLNGGQLNPEQQTTFVKLVKDYSKLMGMVRVERMPQAKWDIDKIHVGEPITEAVTEDDSSAGDSTPKFNKVSLIASKVRSRWYITTESLQQNIEQDKLEDTLMDMMAKRWATDAEMLAIQGDVATYTGGTDPVSKLLQRLNGFDYLTEGAHLIDANAASIQKGIYALAKRRMPKAYKGDPGLRWLTSTAVVDDWSDLLAERATGLGDAALQGGGVKPYGVPLDGVPLIPDDKVISVLAATPGWAKGTRYGPFDIFDSGASQNNKLNIDIDNAGVVAVTLTAGTHETVEIARQINAALGADVAFDDGEGRLLIQSTTTGATSEVDIQAIANDAYTTLGLTVATNAGSDAGTADNVREGSFLLLTNPKNLIVGILDGTRIYAEFNKDRDRIEVVMYNQVAVAIENIEAVVKVKNIRLRTLF